VFLTLLRILLIWWILTIIFRWVGRLGSSKSDTRTVADSNKKSNAFSDIPFEGEIEDADFEEIDNR
jgi:hypothetical protein